MRNLIRRFFLVQTSSITRAAWTIALASLVSRLLGVFRDRILASSFGAGDVLDMYYAAFRVPDFIYNLIIVGALSAGFIPVFIAFRRSGEQSGEESAWELTNVFLTISGIALVVVAILLGVFAPILAPLIAPGFTPEKQAAVAALTRIILFSPILLGLSAILGGVLQAYRNFFIYSLAPIFYNVGIIFGALFLVPFYGVSGLAWGVVIGAFFHFLTQFFAVWRLGWRPHFIWQPRHSGLHEIMRLMVPRTLSLATQQLNIVFLTIIASFLASGSLAIFNFSSNLYFVPVAFFGISYALAVFPALSEMALQENDAGFRALISSAVRSVLFFIVPATILFVLLRAQIVRVLFGSGAFDWNDTVLTFESLRWLSMSMFASSLIPVLVRGFYARHNTMIPFAVGILSDALTIAGAYYLSRFFGVLGLAMAFSLGAVFQVVGLWVFLHFIAGDMDEKRIFFSVIRFTIAGMIMAVAVQGVKNIAGTVLGTNTFIALSLQAALASLAGVVIYAIVLWFMQSEELHEFITALSRKRERVKTTLGALNEGESL
ncbi:MAG: murein biosynthesis integral membrane protein MurJ [Patescibacteria group bacterium]|jgi:putative peptidoglycan lipid II flippase